MDFKRYFGKEFRKRLIVIFLVTFILLITATLVSYKEGETAKANFIESIDETIEQSPHVGDFYEYSKDRYFENPLSTTAGTSIFGPGYLGAGYLMENVDLENDPDSLSDDAADVYAKQLNTVFRNFQNITGSAQHNYNELLGTSELHLIRKAEYAAMQLKDEGYDYFPEKEVFEQSGVSEMLISYLALLNSEQQAIMNGMSTSNENFEDVYEDMETGIKSTNSQTYSSSSATNSKKYEVITGYSFQEDSYYYFANQPMYLFFWDGLDANMYLQDTDGNKIDMDAHDIETPESSITGEENWNVQNSQNMGCYKIEPDLDTEDYPKYMKLVVDGESSVYPIGYAFDNTPSDLYPVHMGMEVRDTDGDGYDKHDEWEVQGVTRHEGSGIKTATWDDDSGMFSYGDTISYEYFAEGDGEYYSTDVKDMLNQTFDLVQQVKTVWDTVRDAAEAQFDLYESGDQYFPIDAAFANIEQIEQLDVEELRMLAAAYVSGLNDTLNEGAYQLDIDELNVTEEFFQNFRITGYVKDSEGNPVIGSESDPVVYAPHVSTQSTNISKPYHVMEQNGLLIYLGDAVNKSSTKIADGSEHMQVQNLESGYNLTIESMSVDTNDNGIPEYIDSIDANVKEWEFVVANVTEGGAGSPTDVTTPEEFITDLLQKYMWAIGLGVTGIAVMAVTDNNQMKLIGAAILLIAIIIAAVQIWVIPAISDSYWYQINLIKIIYWSG